jgi:mono/diheme cytochrome c family protein
MNRLNASIAIVSFSLLGACAGGTANGGAQTEPKADPAAGEVESFGAQVAKGQALFGEHCAKCHGAAGEGATGPAVVGLKSGALPLEPKAGSARKVQFVTVADVGGFVMKAMPPDSPGGLAPDEYLAILAFDLKANGIELDQKLDLEKAKTLTVPR